ncbi:MAG: hypothetical protein M3522_13280, partial [Actinomycetota bacterium]|nr:hypothetical protein [Actinomycetota bacterium]
PVEDAIVVVGLGMFTVVGALLVARRPGNPIGWILSATSLVVLAAALENYAAYVMTTRGRPDWLAIVGVWANSWYWFLFLGLVLVYLPLLFPDGRLPSRRWLPVAVVPGIALVAMVVLGALVDTLSGQDIDYRIENPIGIEGLAHVEDMPLVLGVLGVPLLIGCVGGVAAVVVRLRRSRGVERQQMKWFLYAAAPIPTFPFTDYLPGIVGGFVSGLVFGWVLIGLPMAIGIAVLRYRLYGIDVVINRTLVYGALTASLALVYLGGIAVLQGMFRALTGQEFSLAVVASTLVIAALFSPLRRRIQGFIDRRFYRRKYDAARTLRAFSAKLREETDLDGLNTGLLEVVRDTVQPQHASLWLREPGRGARKSPQTGGS